MKKFALSYIVMVTAFCAAMVSSITGDPSIWILAILVLVVNIILLWDTKQYKKSKNRIDKA